MPSIHLDDLSPFGRLALKLDREFAELVQAGEQMSKVNLETDGGLDDGLRILNRVAQQGQSLAGTMQQFSQALQEARDGAEAATKLVADKALIIKERREKHEAIEQKLTQLKEGVKAAGETLAGFRMPPGVLTDEDKRKIAAELERVREPMRQFIEAIRTVKDEAAGAGFKRLERQAESMIDSLQSSLDKITRALSGK